MRVQIFTKAGKRTDEFETPDDDPKTILDLIAISHPGPDAFKVRVENDSGSGFWMLVGAAPASSSS